MNGTPVIHSDMAYTESAQGMAVTQKLLDLYRIDMQLRGLQSRLDTARRYYDAQNHHVEVLEQEHNELESRERQLQATIANLENDIASIDERIEKIREELNGAVNKKQYDAALEGLTHAKGQRSETEERMLEEMEKVEEVNNRLEEVDQQVTERRRVRDVAKSQLEERQTEVGDRLTDLEQQRQQAAAEVPSDALQKFEEAADMHDGEAMAEIEEIDRRNREYACGACNMHLPFETVALLTAGNDSIIRCSACGRILYMEEEMRGALAKK